MCDVRFARLEIFLKQSRRDKILVTPHKAKPQCGVRSRSVGCEAAVWGREEVNAVRRRPAQGEAAVWGREEATP